MLFLRRHCFYLGEHDLEVLFHRCIRPVVLLFRNEREGIRADLLSLVDATVEIPQAGVIRSLNVHVSGALCISEYARKYLNLVK